jgi:hypothetical protein
MGNSGSDVNLQKGGVVSGDSEQIPVVSMPYLYTMELDSENDSNRDERAKLSILYQY